jgi:S-adenosylmethionine/arginine decarboxylase-like enzyme
MVGLEKKLALYGFNNLTKTLSFNIFDVCYAKTEREKQDYIRLCVPEHQTGQPDSIGVLASLRAAVHAVG